MIREFKVGDYVKVTGLPGRAGNIEDVDNDEVFIGMYGTVTESVWHNSSHYEGIVQVKLDHGQGWYWWEEESLELITAEEIREEFMRLIGLETG